MLSNVVEIQYNIAIINTIYGVDCVKQLQSTQYFLISKQETSPLDRG